MLMNGTPSRFGPRPGVIPSFGLGGITPGTSVVPVKQIEDTAEAARIGHQVGVLWVEECPLRLAEIAKPQFVYYQRADGPSMRNIDLLRTSGVAIAEPLKQIWGGCLESCKRLCVERIVEVIVDTQILFVTDLVVKFQRELVGMGMVIGDGTEGIGSTGREVRTVGVGIRAGHITLHYVDCDGVQATRRNYTAGKKRSVCVADRGAEIATGIENIRN